MDSQQPIAHIDPEREDLLLERRVARMERRKQHRRTRIILWGSISSCVVLLGLIGFIFLQIQSILAYNATYPTTNGIPCDSVMQSAYHIHVHLTIYVNGKSVTVPQGVGIASDGSCFYWMHTHTSDGIIHLEAPNKRTLSLDDFLNIWYTVFPKLGPPAELNQVGWKIFVNGKLRPEFSTAAPLHIELPLSSHDIVTMEFGSPNPAPDTSATYHFPANLTK